MLWYPQFKYIHLQSVNLFHFLTDTWLQSPSARSTSPTSLLHPHGLVGFLKFLRKNLKKHWLLKPVEVVAKHLCTNIKEQALAHSESTLKLTGCLGTARWKIIIDQVFSPFGTEVWWFGGIQHIWWWKGWSCLPPCYPQSIDGYSGGVNE